MGRRRYTMSSLHAIIIVTFLALLQSGDISGSDADDVPLVTLTAKQDTQVIKSIHKSVKGAIAALVKPKISKKIDKLLVDTGFKQLLPHIFDVWRSMDIPKLTALMDNPNLANMLQKLQIKDGFTIAINVAHTLSWKEDRKLATQTAALLKALTKDQMQSVWDKIEDDDLAVLKKFLKKAVPVLLEALG